MQGGGADLAAAIRATDADSLVRSLLGESPLPMLVCAPDGRSLHANEAFRRLAGGAPAEGESVVREGGFVPEAVLGPLRHAFGGEAVTLDPAWLTPPGDGSRRLLVRVRARPLCDAGGTVTAVILQYEDLTAMQAARAEREQFLTERDAVLRASPAGIMICDPRGRVRLVNEAATRILGPAPAIESIHELARYRAVRRDASPLAPEEWPLARALRGETVEAEELRIERSDGQPGAIVAGAAPLRDADGRDLGATMVFTDVTHLRELERMRDQFITVAAHELRTPLTTLLGYAQMLGRRLRGGTPREQIEATTENITRAGRRLDMLVNQLVDVSRLERGSLSLLPKPCDLAAIARQVVDDIAFRYPATPFNLEAPDAVTGTWDAGRLEQVLHGLLDNSVKYGLPGGPVRLCLTEERGVACVVVENDGGMLDEETMLHLFDRYYRAPPHRSTATPGMGLGLYMAREIVRAHGGTIEAIRRPGGGLTVTFSLPREKREG